MTAPVAPVVIALPALSARPEAPPVSALSDQVLARPLFAANRQPPPGVIGASDAPPRLAGTIRTHDALLAVFAAAEAGAGAGAGGAGKSLVVGQGGTVAGWTVIAIEDGAVTLERAGQSARVRVSFSGAPVPPPAPRPPSVAKMVLLHTKRTSPFLQW